MYLYLGCLFLRLYLFIKSVCFGFQFVEKYFVKGGDLWVVIEMYIKVNMYEVVYKVIFFDSFCCL